MVSILCTVNKQVKQKRTSQVSKQRTEKRECVDTRCIVNIRNKNIKNDLTIVWITANKYTKNNRQYYEGKDL
jgi:hypothetical protein